MSRDITAPDGTVTFLMTDVEGSTPLWEADAVAMRAAMALHDREVEAAITESGGIVVKPRGEGDSRFCVFGSPADSLRAAARIQRALAVLEWPTEVPIRVRIGIYLGHAERADDGDYYGTGPNRCARLRDLGHGAQVLVSSSAAATASDDLPGDVELLPLGRFRFRGIEIPEPVYQLAAPGLQRDFPPLRAPAMGNLPEPLTSFIGRSDEIKQLASTAETRRLITLTGSAGVGKTRLAIEVARAIRGRRADGVWFVELAAITDPAEVLRTVLETFGLTEEEGRAPGQILDDYLRTKDLVVVLDNCEHLVAACAEIGARMLQAPGCRLIATSREPLGATGEVTWRVASLGIPGHDVSAGDLETYSAAELFMTRARDAEPMLIADERVAEATARICRRLDGIPLAIELAAGRVGVFDVTEIARQVEEHFDLLTGGPRTALERQQTIRAAIDWSFDLLSEPEQEALMRMSVFAGGFTLDAARHVCAGEHAASEQIPDLVATLARKSLLSKDDQPGRYRLLEMVRVHARDKLAAVHPASDPFEAHLAFFASIGAAAAPALEDARDQARLDELARDHDNLMKALRYAAARVPDAGLALATDIGRYLNVRGHWTLGLGLVVELIANSPDAPAFVRARGLRLQGDLAKHLGKYDAARAGFEQASAIATAIGDRSLEARMTGELAMLDAGLGDYTRARSLFEQALATARDLGDEKQITSWIGGLGMVASYEKDYAASRAYYEEALTIARKRSDISSIATALGNIGVLDILQGAYGPARARFEQALTIARELGNRRMNTFFIANLGHICHAQGDHEEARVHYEEALALGRDLGYRHAIATMVGSVGDLDRIDGDYAAARSKFEEAVTLSREMGERPILASALAGLGLVELDAGDRRTARVRLKESLENAREVGPPAFEDTLTPIAHLAGAEADHETACVLASAAQRLRDGSGMRLFANAQQREDELKARLEEHLGPVAFAAAWERGHALEPERALELAETYLRSSPMAVGTGM